MKNRRNPFLTALISSVMIVSYVTTSFVPVYVFAEDDEAAAETADVLMTEEAVPAEEPSTEDTSALDEPSSVLTIH